MHNKKPYISIKIQIKAATNTYFFLSKIVLVHIKKVQNATHRHHKLQSRVTTASNY